MKKAKAGDRITNIKYKGYNTHTDKKIEHYYSDPKGMLVGERDGSLVICRGNISNSLNIRLRSITYTIINKGRPKYVNKA